MKLRGDRCQCRGCFEYFNSTSAFDFHRTGSYRDGRRCLSIDEMLAKGMAKRESGFWVSKLKPLSTMPILHGRTSESADISSTPVPDSGSEQSPVLRAHTSVP
jgi:hypothetical protein